MKERLRNILANEITFTMKLCALVFCIIDLVCVLALRVMKGYFSLMDFKAVTIFLFIAFVCAVVVISLLDVCKYIFLLIMCTIRGDKNEQ